MSTIAIILLATFTAADFTRIRLDKAEEPYIDGRAFEHGATSVAEGSEGSEPSSPGSWNARAVAEWNARAVASAAASARAGVAHLEPPGLIKRVSSGLAHLESPGQLAARDSGEADGSEADSAGAGAAAASSESPGDNEPALHRAIAALDAAVDQSDVLLALGASDLEASLARLDAINVKLADLLSHSLANREKLYAAAGRGEVDVVNDLVKQRLAEVNSLVHEVRNEDGWTGTPIQHAAQQGYTETVEALLIAGAEKDCSDTDSRSPLWLAAGGLGDSLGVMRVLLEEKALTESACMNGLLPLHIAASKGRETAVRMLLDFGADVDGNGASSDQLSGKNRGSPLVDATYHVAHFKVARVLIEAGADPDLASSRGRSPLHNCAEWGNAEMSRLLLEADAHKDATDEDGKTPLFVAAQAGNTEVARILIEAGARSCLSNNNGEMPITVAKNEEIRKMLEMIPKVAVTIASLDDSHEVVVTSAGPSGGDKPRNEGVVGRIRRISKSLLGSGIIEVMKLPNDSTLGALLAEVAQKLGTDPPMVEVLLPSGNIAPHADDGDMQKTLQDLLAAKEAETADGFAGYS